MSGRTRERLLALLFVAPATLLIAVFVLWPTVSMAQASLHREAWSSAAPSRFVQAENYAALLADQSFRRSVRNTVLFAALVVPGQVVLALGLAVWANRPGGTNRFLRISIFIPTTISLAVLAVLWKLMYEPTSATGSGLFNGFLTAAGLPDQPFLTSPRQALPAIVVMSIWQGVGLQMLIFLAGLQGIPAQLYEAAQLDGAGSWRRFRHITLPGLAPTAVFVVMITTIFALKLFVQPFVMTGGGPRGSTRSVVQYIYEAAFFRHDLGLACAASVVFFVGVLAVTVILRRTTRWAEALQ